MNDASTVGTSLGESRMDSPGARSVRRTAVTFALLFASYAFLAWVGLQWAMVGGSASPVWPAAGAGLAALLVSGKRLWPAVTLGTLLAYQVNSATNPLIAQLAAALGNGLATFAAAALFERISGRVSRDVTLLQVAALIAASLALGFVAAVIGVGALYVTGAVRPELAFNVSAGWFFGDSAGALVVGAVALTWRRPLATRPTGMEAFHLLSVLVATGFASAVIFLGAAAARAWMIYPLLVWSALVLRLRGAALAVFLVTCFAVAGASMDLGPFSSALPGETGVGTGIPLLQQYILITAGTILVLAAVADERRHDVRLRQAIAEQQRFAQSAEVAQRAARSSLYEYDVPADRTTRDPYVLNLCGYGTGEVDLTRAGWEALIHDDDRADFRSTVARAIEGHDRFAMEYRVNCKDGRVAWISDTGQIVRAPGGQALRIFGMVTDITERRQAHEDLRMRTAELEVLLASAPIGFAYFTRDYRYVRINEVLAEINGVPVADHLGRTIKEVLPKNAPAVEPIIDQVFATGEAVGNIEVSGETPRSPGTICHWLTGFFPVKAANQVEAVGAWVIEISERKAAEERESLLAREVDHRAKNLLTVVQSVVQMTRADDAETLRQSVIGRVQALARAHSLLAAARWEGVDMMQLAQEELAPFSLGDSGRVRIAGARLHIRPAAAQSLALVLHELATNAAKYGALSTDHGTLTIAWDQDAGQPDSPIVLEWIEIGAVVGGSPSRSGFGSRMIKASIERQLKGRVDFRWEPTGLKAMLQIPASNIVRPADDIEETAAQSADPGVAKGRIDGSSDCRILIVEDEALIGLQLEQALETLGCVIVGVATNVAEAFRLIEEGTPSGAVLDINLHGEHSFPIADRLADAGIPFVFCTGYADGAIIPARFAPVPLFRKPFDAKAIAALFVEQVDSGA